MSAPLLDAARVRLLAALRARVGQGEVSRILVAARKAASAAERRDRAASDAFLLGFLIPRVRAHFDGLTRMLGLRDASPPPLAERVRAHLGQIEAQGAEVASSVMEVEDGLVRHGAAAPPSPRAPGQGAAWASACEAQLAAAFEGRSWPANAASVPALAAAMREHERARAAVELGRRIGELFEALHGLALIDDLVGHAGGDPQLEAARAERRAALTTSLDHFETLLRDPKLPVLLGDAWLERARHAWFVVGRDTSETAPPRPWRPPGEAWRPDPWTARFVIGELVPIVEAMLAPQRSTPREAITAFQARAIDLPQLLRALVEHAGWKVPAVLQPGAEPRALILAGGFPRVLGHGGLSCVHAYSDDRAVAANPDPTGLTPYLVGAGHRVLATLGTDVDALDLDPNVEGGMRWNRSAIGELIAAVRVGGVAAAVRHWAWVDRSRVAGFEAYFAPMHGDEIAKLTLRDRAGRSFAVVCTSEEAVAAFAAERGGELGDLRWTKIAGPTVFSAIAARGGDGVWFDPAGPGRDRRFDAAFVEQLGRA